MHIYGGKEVDICIKSEFRDTPIPMYNIHDKWSSSLL